MMRNRVKYFAEYACRQEGLIDMNNFAFPIDRVFESFHQIRKGGFAEYGTSVGDNAIPPDQLDGFRRHFTWSRQMVEFIGDNCEEERVSCSAWDFMNKARLSGLNVHVFTKLDEALFTMGDRDELLSGELCG